MAMLWGAHCNYLMSLSMDVFIFGLMLIDPSSFSFLLWGVILLSMGCQCQFCCHHCHCHCCLHLALSHCQWHFMVLSSLGVISLPLQFILSHPCVLSYCQCHGHLLICYCHFALSPAVSFISIVTQFILLPVGRSFSSSTMLSSLLALFVRGTIDYWVLVLTSTVCQKDCASRIIHNMPSTSHFPSPLFKFNPIPPPCILLLLQTPLSYFQPHCPLLYQTKLYPFSH